MLLLVRCTWPTISAMHYLTRKEYRELTNDSRQSVHNKISRGTLKTIMRKIATEVIMVEDTEYEKLKSKTLTV